jgi:hypothetical protein
MSKVTEKQRSEYAKRALEDMNKANKIIAGELPAQETQGVMTSAERRASIAKAFGAKPKVTKASDKEFKKGGQVSSASKRADGCATKGKTKGRML